ncbi:TetR/AcrR family transcriptional regulator [Bradyrhizobium sp. 141]|uniref:acrylate utilization transcriptional regulator AcuR n=1 Tax=Bradyrhizobium sp. 141 TaxID=2782617 RepID=UPI001FFA1DC2|nr:TetR/AcrR family transcriptional regulator [Bradyrhizobium sp. 141]MCK1719828.1 TetR/AcrR family transcriptional regulator [Bradyrhizobium sp. 141]
MAKSADYHRQLNVKGRNEVGYAPTRVVLIRCGMEVMTQQGFAATGLDALLRRATVPKGSFYHYFESKADYGREIMKAYDSFFRHKLDRALNDGRLAPLARMRAFVDDAKAGMAKYSYTRGCLVGNLSQEVEALPDDYRSALDEIVKGWQRKVAHCLELACEAGEIGSADCDALAEFFWIGWEGAVMRARLVKNGLPLDTFIAGFVAGLPRPDEPKTMSRRKS